MRIWRLGRAIRASLQGGRKRRVEAAGQEVETLGENSDGGGRRLASGGRKTGEGTKELGTPAADTKQGGGRQESVGECF